MIIPIVPLSVYELASSHCVMNNRYLLYFENKLFSSFTEEKKDQIAEFYSDYIPETILDEVRDGRTCAIEYSNEDVVLLNASEWFPPIELCPDPSYFFRCLVFDNNANIIFENISPPKKLTNPGQ